MIESQATMLAALAGIVGVAAGRELVLLVRERLDDSTAQLARATEALESALRPFRLAGERGLLPSDRERLRLQLLAGVAGFSVGLFIWGAKIGAVAALTAAWLGSRVLVWRRDRYRAAVDAEASTFALALADTLAVGHSVRGALVACAGSVKGAIGGELATVARTLEVGGSTDSALASLRERCRSRRIDLICAGIAIQRRSGGALATLLRRVARTINEQDRLADEARAASAQARTTSRIVALLPFAGLVLGELGAPGLLGKIAGSGTGRGLLVAAVALQVAGTLIVMRLSRLNP